MVDIAASAAPTVTIYLNGNSNFYGKKFVVNRRRVRTLDAFLDNVTVDIKSSTAVRRLCTPLGTHEVNSLETLEHGGKYVAVTSIGRSGFKKLNYNDLGILRNVPRAQKTKEVQVRSRFVVSGRARKEYEWEKLALRIINVYRNGDEFQPSTRVLLKRKILLDMELVLNTCQEHMVLNSAIAALYTTEGKLVDDTKLLENGGMYVAVERRRPFFRCVNYGDRAHVPLKRSGPAKLPPIATGRLTGSKTKTPRKTKSISPTKVMDALPSSRAQETISQLNSIPPVSSRDLTPDHLGKEHGKLSYELESEADFNPSVSPPVHLEQTPISDIPKQASGKVSEGPPVFQASGLQREEAKAVRDTRDTAEEKPVDLLPAEEVVEDLLPAEEVVEDLEVAENEDNRKSQDSPNSVKRDISDSDSDVESLPDVTENTLVPSEEHSQKVLQDERQDEEKFDARRYDDEEQENGSRESTSHSGRESNTEKPEARDVKEAENEKAGSIADSPVPPDTVKDSSDVENSADLGSGKEDERDAENEDAAETEGDEQMRDEDGDSKTDESLEPIPVDDNRVAEDDKDTHAQNDKEGERSSAKEIHAKGKESDQNDNES